jgi:hypothetical protein
VHEGQRRAIGDRVAYRERDAQHHVRGLREGDEALDVQPDDVPR